MNMNISTGGPHILFFERDSSLMALLISEFQLAGYECHTARTAVEVFDAIARHPIRVLLVNLSQAAAGRREFWVALDTQRRGRGVQVFTYHCYNLAGYGPHETDERSSSVAVDMEIDGMLGLMSLVERIRERVPVTSATTGTIPRFSRASSPAPSSYPSSSSQSSQSATSVNGTGYRNETNGQEYARGSSGVTLNPAAQTNSTLSATNGGQQSYTDKVRAVLYSNPRPTAPTPTGPAVVEPVNATNAMNTVQQASSSVDAPSLQQLAYGQTMREPRESGLAQLSRMVQEYQPPIIPEDTGMTFSRQATDSISSQPLRASPIEDLPLERGYTSSTAGEAARRGDTGTRTSYGYGTHGTSGQRGQTGYENHQETAAPTTLASISTTMPVTPAMSARPTVPIPAVNITVPIPVVYAPAPATKVQEPRVEREEQRELRELQERVEEPEIRETRPSEVQEKTSTQQAQQASVQNTERIVTIEETQEARKVELPEAKRQAEEDREDRVDRGDKEDKVDRVSQVVRRDTRDKEEATSQEMVLADIIQSLPASLTPGSAQPQIVNGKPIRSLGSVLLEGHLVPQSRLEVAQNIQRMLRGVDLRYELGEILLMFKLLTPDQLLAATLVSNGLISTQQITALGRIRQELHSIGLEYDLESLLILFRMLTPEQLREARASWQG